ncbi:hypothetical protein [Nostoc sp.]|uniref:hypothetical protein n=1 Tax=Nostoc sp. TaxID=1180 RepID=UPI002FF8510D
MQSVQSENFFKFVHNTKPTFINTPNSTAPTLWQTLFDPTNPFDLTLQIADLPTGQLAEAQITNYDPQGRPNGGTILIDDDANGIGWFIDPTPLVGTSIGLTQTDSLLNLQQSGNAYFSNNVKIAGANTSGDFIALNTPRTVKIDISNIAPGTLATLYFDLLGFGAKDGKVIIDNVMLLDKNLISPTAIADTATTDQAKPVCILLLSMLIKI